MFARKYVWVYPPGPPKFRHRFMSTVAVLISVGVIVATYYAFKIGVYMLVAKFGGTT